MKNYIELINRFWRIDETAEFSPSETRLYFYLLKIANAAMWPDQFDVKDKKLCGNVGLTANTLKPARIRLVNHGLLSVELSAPGLREGTTYHIIEEGKESGKASVKESKKESKNDAFPDDNAEKNQKKRQSKNQHKHQKLTLSYIYNDLNLKPETLNNTLSVAHRDDARIRKQIQDLLNQKKKKKPPRPAQPPPINIPFETWWEAYDKRIDKKACEPKWNRLSDEQRQAALTHTGRYVLETPNPKYRKNPETYLNRESWNNQPLHYEPERRQSGNSPRPLSPAHQSPEQRLDFINDVFAAIDSVVGKQ